jgi:replication initiator protein
VSLKQIALWCGDVTDQGINIDRSFYRLVRSAENRKDRSHGGVPDEIMKRLRSWISRLPGTGPNDCVFPSATLGTPIWPENIFFGTDILSGTAKVVQRSRFSFFHEAQIWYSRDPPQYPISDQFENVIVLSDEFYREITAHPIPADLEAVKVLAGAPAVLDLFMWLSYRCFLPKTKRGFRCLEHMAWRVNSGRSNMHGRGAFGRNSTRAWIPSACFGQSVRPRSARMAQASS